MMKKATTVEIWSKDQIKAEVKRLRRKTSLLIRLRIIRPWCLESDLKTLAYNMLTRKMMRGRWHGKSEHT
jgi:hypothetical protein